MYNLRKKITFEAAHHLPHHDGKCQRRHGHSWIAWIELRGEKLVTEGPKQGMLADFGDVKAACEPLLDGVLDHHDLNETTKIENPTSEAIATMIYNYLKPRLPLLAAVEVEETCTSACRYEP
jgi:6-pyruvoyltetrahydropterin/6-carboxytetrahydropterin synthase